MNVTFKVDVALDPKEKWPTRLPALPRVGDLVESGYCWPVAIYDSEMKPQQLVLEVSDIIWKCQGFEWIPCIYLRPGPRFNSLAEFRIYYAKLIEANS